MKYGIVKNQCIIVTIFLLDVYLQPFHQNNTNTQLDLVPKKIYLTFYIKAKQDFVITHSVMCVTLLSFISCNAKWNFVSAIQCDY